MTLGTTAAAQVRLIVWCKSCQHQVEPDPAEMAARYGADTSVLDWREKLVCSQCGGRQADMVVTGTAYGRGLMARRLLRLSCHLREVGAIAGRPSPNSAPGATKSLGRRPFYHVQREKSRAASRARRRGRTGK